MSRLFLTVGFSIVSSVFTGLSHAQRISRNPDAAEVAALLRQTGRPGAASRVLAQLDGPLPRERLDSIADTLVAVALSLRGDDHLTVLTRRSAVDALLLAGIGEGGVPYAGAPERLLRLALELPSGGALWSLTKMPDRRQALQYMRQVATADHGIAYAAVGHLGRDMGPEGLALLRQLHDQGLVTEEHALRELNALARYHGWPEP